MNGFGRFMTEAFLGNTEVGRKLLGQETLAEQSVCEGLMAQAALRAFRDYQDRREADSRWRDDGGHGKAIQFEDDEVRVEVVNGYSRDYDQYTTDIKVMHRDSRASHHLHVIYDERGREIMNEWRPNAAKR